MSSFSHVSAYFLPYTLHTESHHIGLIGWAHRKAHYNQWPTSFQKVLLDVLLPGAVDLPQCSHDPNTNVSPSSGPDYMTKTDPSLPPVWTHTLSTEAGSMKSAIVISSLGLTAHILSNTEKACTLFCKVPWFFSLDSRQHIAKLLKTEACCYFKQLLPLHENPKPLIRFVLTIAPTCYMITWLFRTLTTVEVTGFWLRVKEFWFKEL